MNEKRLSVAGVAPLLRGLTFDGEKGATVVFSEKLTHAEEAGGLTVDLRGLNAEEVAERLGESFRRGQGSGGTSVVACPPVGTFYLAATYDEAAALRDSVESGTGSSQVKRPAARSVPGEGVTSLAPGTADRNRIVENKISVITGAAQGFGEEIARSLAAAGSLVFIADLNERGAAEVAEELNAHHGRTCAFPVGVDMAEEESVRAMVETVARTAGGIDLFISNAGVLKAGSVKELAAKDFEFVTRVNYTGYFLGVKWVAPIMALQNRASGRYFSDIIQINSKSGLEGSNKNGAYAGSKFGGIGLTQSFALELVSDNIKVNAICPGNFFEGPLWSDPDRGLFVQYLRAGKVPGAKSVGDVKAYYEGRVPMGRGCSGADVMKAILYIVEQKYETGQALPVTGGQVMLS